MRLNWQEELALPISAARRVVLLGIGSPLKSDDAAGMLLIEELQRRGLDQSRILLLFGSTAPENFTGVIRAYAPELLLVVDAARLGLEPGTVALLDDEELASAGFSTHMLPLPLMLRYLEQDGLRQIFLLGLEPASTEFGFELSPAVGRAVGEIADFLADTLNGR